MVVSHLLKLKSAFVLSLIGGEEDRLPREVEPCVCVCVCASGSSAGVRSGLARMPLTGGVELCRALAESGTTGPSPASLEGRRDLKPGGSSLSLWQNLA